MEKYYRIHKELYFCRLQTSMRELRHFTFPSGHEEVLRLHLKLMFIANTSKLLDC